MSKDKLKRVFAYLGLRHYARTLSRLIVAGRISPHGWCMAFTKE